VNPERRSAPKFSFETIILKIHAKTRFLVLHPFVNPWFALISTASWGSSGHGLLLAAELTDSRDSSSALSLELMQAGLCGGRWPQCSQRGISACHRRSCRQEHGKSLQRPLT